MLDTYKKIPEKPPLVAIWDFLKYRGSRFI